MDDFDYATEAAREVKGVDSDTYFDIPEPIDQWSVEDFEQFASLIIDAE